MTLDRDQIRSLKQSGRLAEAESLLRAALADRPGDPWVRVSLADLYMRQGKLLEAEHLAAEVLAERPEHAGALTVLGNLHYRQRAYDQAQTYFDAAVRAGGGEYAAGRLADTLLKQKRFAEALELCRARLEPAPDSPRFLRPLAAAQEGLGQREAAAETYRRLLELTPDDQFAYSRYVRLQTSGADPARASGEVERLLRVGSRERNPHLHMLAGDRKKQAGDLAGALAAYQRALELDPADLYARKQAGFCLSRLERHAEAVAMLEPVVLADPADYYTRNSLLGAARRAGLALDVAGRLREAVVADPSRRPLWALIRRLEQEAGEPKS